MVLGFKKSCIHPSEIFLKNIWRKVEVPILRTFTQKIILLLYLIRNVGRNENVLRVKIDKFDPFIDKSLQAMQRVLWMLVSHGLCTQRQFSSSFFPFASDKYLLLCETSLKSPETEFYVHIYYDTSFCTVIDCLHIHLPSSLYNPEEQE